MPPYDNEVEDLLSILHERELLEIVCETTRSTLDFIICPICNVSPLYCTRSVFFCSCGLVLNTEADSISLSFLKYSIESCVTEHLTECKGKLNFLVKMNLLWATCTECNMETVVI
eukprot:TRINITY_DN3953_c0_g1_i2.p2 TRINITY_DN3953_c0_g1~~TRINITY_DN3953_c0_g1_i2.p2  ORF type:complete len:115 (-),score=9.63 TRINITY_DN3953_c0_g1_i2:82-426(-)